MLRNKNQPPPADVDDDSSSDSEFLSGSSIFGHVDPDTCLEDSERAMEAARRAMWDNGQQHQHQHQQDLSAPRPSSLLALNPHDSHASFNHFLAAFNEAQKNPVISQVSCCLERINCPTIGPRLSQEVRTTLRFTRRGSVPFLLPIVHLLSQLCICQAIQNLACNENVYNSILSQQELIPLLRAFGATDVQGE